MDIREEFENFFCDICCNTNLNDIKEEAFEIFSGQKKLDLYDNNSSGDILNFIGLLHMHGSSIIPVNWNLAQEYFSMAVINKNIDALVNLAITLRAPCSLESDNDTLNSYLKKQKDPEKEGNIDPYEIGFKMLMEAAEQGNLNALLELASLYLADNNFKKAEEYFQQYYARDGAYKEFHVGQFYFAWQKYDKAEKYLVEAAGKNWRHLSVTAMNYLGRIYTKLGNLEKAEEYFIKQGEPEDLGRHYLKQGKYGEAEKYFHLSLEKGDKCAAQNLAYLYVETGDKKLAEKYFIDACNKDDRLAKEVAEFYMEQGDYDNAEKYYKKLYEGRYYSSDTLLKKFYTDIGKPELANSVKEFKKKLNK